MEKFFAVGEFGPKRKSIHRESEERKVLNRHQNRSTSPRRVIPHRRSLRLRSRGYRESIEMVLRFERPASFSEISNLPRSFRADYGEGKRTSCSGGSWTRLTTLTTATAVRRSAAGSFRALECGGLVSITARRITRQAGPISWWRIEIFDFCIC